LSIILPFKGIDMIDLECMAGLHFTFDIFDDLLDPWDTGVLRLGGRSKYGIFVYMLISAMTAL
jgi:hypothetical protein